MDFIEQFEYPLPILSVDKEKIIAEITVLGFSGSIEIKNIGGSLLCGNIISNCPFIIFKEESFKGNRIEVGYEINLDYYNIGDIINNSIVIMSNGGEKIIPIIIKVIPNAIITVEGERIISLKDFSNYAKKYLAQGRILLVSNEFQHWLINTSYEHMDIYYRIIKDSNKERALENFLILNKLKKPAKLVIENKKINIEIFEDRKNIIKRELEIKKVGWGYVSQEITTEYSATWFKIAINKENLLPIETLKLTSSDFDKNEVCKLIYEIDPNKIDKNYATEKIIISEAMKVEINIVKKPIYTISLEKNFLKSNDMGKVLIENKSADKKEIVVDITVRDNFLKFASKRYFVKDILEIPFYVKISPIQIAQMAIKKQPVAQSEIYVMISGKEKVISKTLNITVGDFGDK